MTDKALEVAAQAACKNVEDANPSVFSSQWIEEAWPQYIPQVRVTIEAWLAAEDEERVKRVAIAVCEEGMQRHSGDSHCCKMESACVHRWNEMDDARAAIKAMA
jgi:hypothetical protein